MHSQTGIKSYKEEYLENKRNVKVVLEIQTLVEELNDKIEEISQKEKPREPQMFQHSNYKSSKKEKRKNKGNYQ